MLPDELTQIKINGASIPYVGQAKNLGLLITPSLNWQPQITSITNKVYATLSSLKVHRKSFNAPLRKQLIQTLALTHFDYDSTTFMNSEKTRSYKQLTMPAYASFYGNISRFPSANITTHLTHRRLHLGWFSIASRHYSKLASLAYSVIIKKHPPYLSTHLQYTPIPPLHRRPNQNTPSRLRVHGIQKSCLGELLHSACEEIAE